MVPIPDMSHQLSKPIATNATPKIDHELILTPEACVHEEDQVSNNDKLNSALLKLANQAASTINEESSNNDNSSSLVHQNNLLKE